MRKERAALLGAALALGFLGTMYLAERGLTLEQAKMAQGQTAWWGALYPAYSLPYAAGESDGTMENEEPVKIRFKVLELFNMQEE